MDDDAPRAGIGRLDHDAGHVLRADRVMIDAVTLYSGKVYRGAIIGRGAELKILIPGGSVQVPARNVKQTVSQ